MGVQPFYGKGPHRLLRTRRAEITGIPNHLNCCVLFIAYSEFTDVASGCIIQAGGLRFGDPCFKKTQLSYVGIMLHDYTGSSTENRTQTHSKINGLTLPRIIGTV